MKKEIFYTDSNKRIVEPIGVPIMTNKKREIRNCLRFYNDDGVIKEDTCNGDGVDYNAFNAFAAKSLKELVSDYHKKMIDTVIENVGIVDDIGDNRKLMTVESYLLKTYLKERPLPETVELIYDYVLYGLCGYYDIFDEMKRIPIANCNVYFYGTEDEYIAFHEKETSTGRRYIEIVPAMKLNNKLEIGMMYAKVVDGVIVESYKEKPYALFVYDRDDVSGEFNSIGRMALSTSLSSSYLNAMLIFNTEMAVSPPIMVDKSINPQSEDDLNTSNMSLDMTPRGVTYVEGLKTGVDHVTNLKNVAIGFSISETMSYQNNVNGVTAMCLNSQASVGSTKSNVTAGAINQVSENQDTVIDMDRRKFIPFLNQIIYHYVRKNKKIGLKNPRQLYHGELDGNLNGEDYTVKNIISMIQIYSSVFGEATLQILDMEKITSLLNQNSVYKILKEVKPQE